MHVDGIQNFIESLIRKWFGLVGAVGKLNKELERGSDVGPIHV